MELKVKMNVPNIESHNFDVIKQEFDAMVSNYKGLIYDVNNIDQAKKDRAMLNNLGKNLNTERLSLEKEWVAPFTEFKDKVNSLVKDIKETSSDIDVQVKAVEETEKQERRVNVESVFTEELKKFDFTISIDKVFNDKWLNKSISDNEIITGMQHSLIDIENDIKTITLLNSEFQTELVDSYLDTLNLPTTIEYKSTLERAKEVAEQKVESVAPTQSTSFDAPIKRDEPEQEYVLTVKCTELQIGAVKRWLESNNIKFMV